MVRNVCGELLERASGSDIVLGEGEPGVAKASRMWQGAGRMRAGHNRGHGGRRQRKSACFLLLVWDLQLFLLAHRCSLILHRRSRVESDRDLARS